MVANEPITLAITQTNHQIRLAAAVRSPSLPDIQWWNGENSVVWFLFVYHLFTRAPLCECGGLGFVVKNCGHI